MRNFFPTTGAGHRRGAQANEQDAAVGLVNKMAGRRLATMRNQGGRAFSPAAGQQASPDDLRATAAYQLLRQKAQSATQGPARLAAQADLQEFEEGQALSGASRDIEQDWRGEIGTTPMTNAYTGKRVDGGGIQHHTKRAASAMANNAALGRPTPVAGEPRQEDPRFTVQYRNEMERRTSANPIDALRARLR